MGGGVLVDLFTIDTRLQVTEEKNTQRKRQKTRSKAKEEKGVEGQNREEGGREETTSPRCRRRHDAFAAAARDRGGGGVGGRGGRNDAGEYKGMQTMRFSWYFLYTFYTLSNFVIGQRTEYRASVKCKGMRQA